MSAYLTSNTMTYKTIWPTLLFYTLAIITIFLLQRFSPSGPCTPGLGALSFLLFIPTVAILFLRNIYLTLKVDKVYWVNLMIHFIALVMMLFVI